MSEPTTGEGSTARAAPTRPGGGTAAHAKLLEQLRRVTLGEYDIAGELGSGGMATVFLAQDLSLDRKVAIKVMTPALGIGPGMVERFKREARTAAALSHPNIIPIYAVREVEGLLFFVMKLIEGTQLDSVMRELGQLPIPMVEAILAQVGGALGYAHRHGVIHRDIKPSNILIDDEGWAIVTDFGIAKVNEAEGLTISGATVGTPTYMSPEQCGGGALTGASDQYSLGVVAFEMLTGRPPFSGANMMAVLFSHFHDAPPPIETLRPNCPPPLRDAVTRMLAKDPKARFPSMEEAVTAIGAHHLAHDDPTRTQLILLARSGASNRAVARIQTPRSPIPLERRRGNQSVSFLRRWGFAAGTGVVALAAAGGAYLALSRGGNGAIESDSTALPSPAVSQGQPPAAPPPAPAVVQGPPPSRNQEAPSPTVTRPSPAPAPAPIAAPPQTQTLAPGPPAPVPPPPPAVTVVPPPAPPVRAERSPAESAGAAATARFTADSLAVSAIILSYARALEAGDLAAAQRLFPGMPDEQRQGLQAFWRAGGSMRTRWSVTAITVLEDVATARVTGTNLVRTQREPESEQTVSLRARLERQAGTWRLTRLAQ
ncbi:MAG: protein kinase domain-containing protein [Gemmatimonadales bacterium]